MPIPVPQQVLNDYLMSRSVMDAPRSAAQRVIDAVFGRTYPEQATNAFTNVQPLALLPGARGVIRNAPLGASWFRGHGGSRPIEDVLHQGFLPRAKVQKLGEPLGVSLTSRPEVAVQFADGNPIMRVAVNTPPENVLDLAGTIPGSLRPPERAQDILRAASADVTRNYRPPGFTTTIAEAIKEKADRLASLSSRHQNPHPALGAPLDRAQSEVHKQLVSNREALTGYNAAMSNRLRDVGYEAVAYHPDRYSEFELRVIDPSRAIPVGTLDPIGFRFVTGGGFFEKIKAGLTEQFKEGFITDEELNAALKYLEFNPGKPTYKEVLDWLVNNEMGHLGEVPSESGLFTFPSNIAATLADLGSASIGGKFGEGAVLSRFGRRFNPKFNAIMEAANQQTGKSHLKQIYKEWGPERYIGGYKEPPTPLRPQSSSGPIVVDWANPEGVALEELLSWMKKD